ncbi:hypothetical protein Efla_006744 [Eimeria flavescens]
MARPLLSFAGLLQQLVLLLQLLLHADVLHAGTAAATAPTARLLLARGTIAFAALQHRPHQQQQQMGGCLSWLQPSACCSSNSRSSSSSSSKSYKRQLSFRPPRGSSLSVASVPFDDDAQMVGALAETLRRTQQQQQQQQQQQLGSGGPSGGPWQHAAPPPDVNSALLQQGQAGAESTAARCRLLASQLLHLGASGAPEATLYINSPGFEADGQGALHGGELEWLSVASLLLQQRASAAAALQQQQLRVTTIGLGHAGGPAALLLACGAPGRRFATPNTWISLKAPPVCCSGTAAAIKARAEASLRDNKLLLDLLLLATQRQQQQQEQEQRIRQLVIEGGALSAPEAKAIGLIDEVSSCCSTN